MTREDPHYQQHVPSTAPEKAADEALRALLASGGQDAVDRIYATVVAQARLHRFYQEAERLAGGPVELDRREHSHPERLGRSGSGRCSEACHRSAEPPGLGDHQRHWRTGNTLALITTDDYDLSWQHLQRLVDYCRSHRYQAHVSASDSYYYAGATVQVLISPANTQDLHAADDSDPGQDVRVQQQRGDDAGGRDAARMPFRKWLRQQRHREDPVGDIARDVADDDCAKGLHVEALREHLELTHYAQDVALEAFEEAVAQWQTAAVSHP